MTPAERARRPRVVALAFAPGDVRGAVLFEAQIDDGASRYRLRLRWTFAGAHRRLAAGHYRWMVWPGIGPRASSRYGKRIVSSTFVVRRTLPAT